MYAPAKTKSGELIFPGQGSGQRDGVERDRRRPAARRASRSARSRSPTTTRTGTGRPSISSATSSSSTRRSARSSTPSIPTCRAFKARGGKLLLYHGWNDTAISAGNTHQLLLERARRRWAEAGRLDPAVHGARHAALRQRPRTESGELHGARSSAGAKSGVAPDQLDRGARHQQPRGHDASALPVSAGRAVQRRRQHERRRELRLQGAGEGERIELRSRRTTQSSQRSQKIKRLCGLSGLRVDRHARPTLRPTRPTRPRQAAVSSRPASPARTRRRSSSTSRSR